VPRDSGATREATPARGMWATHRAHGSRAATDDTVGWGDGARDMAPETLAGHRTWKRAWEMVILGGTGLTTAEGEVRSKGPTT